MEYKPCPFCGKVPDMEDGDTLYPNATAWIYDAELECNVYVSFREAPKEQWCYSFHCPTVSGGCGCEVHGNTKEDAVARWNTRA